ncbi:MULTISPECIES: DUF4231 domain-containing protein [unclassified Nostoc]|uniref:DUF4231 domain-containing protein n=1 Tax=unclassified Nostoc TaxID=2593658 RepID=UPI002AD52EAE|nr:DUF4231 domain-containing protein [Nostoc sp. ChiQUE02]MDZ8234591.1 DUF4231 domain-containing protein [Nostoc sp. ChiQUE02]
MPEKSQIVNLNKQDSEKDSTDIFPRRLSQKQKESLDECERLIQHFKKEALQHKRWFQGLKYSSIFLAATVTILSAIAASKKIEQLNWAVPVISGLATLSTTLLTQTASQKVWVHSRGVEQKLQVEKFLYLQAAGVYSQIANEEEKICQFSNRIMEIWSQGHETWENNVADGINRKSN